MTPEISLMSEKTKLMSQLSDLNAHIEELERAVEEQSNSLTTDIDNARKQGIAEATDQITAEYKDKFIELKNLRRALEEKFRSHAVDESDESVIEMRQRTMYLNQLASQLDKLHTALNEVSTPYFIKLGENEKTFSDKRYHKELKKIDGYSARIYKLADTQILPAKFCEFITPFVTANVAPYVTGVVLSPISVFLFPLYLSRAFKRAKLLHAFSVKYYTMMNTAAALHDSQASQLEALLESVVQTKQDEVAVELEKVKEQIATLEAEQEAKIKAIEFDPLTMEKLLKEAIEDLKIQLEQAYDQRNYTTEQLADVEAKLNDLIENARNRAKEERDPYINPRNPKRSVTFPFKFLYNYTEATNTWSPNLLPGLYIYNTRACAEEIVRVIIFQMRNYMSFGVLRLYIMDVMMGLYAADMVLTNRTDVKVDSQRSDIVMDTLKSDMDARIETLHDLMTRRAIAVKQIATDLNNYNKIQEAAGSAPLTFEIAFYFVESQVNLSEKLIQLLKVGASLGILIFIFVQRDVITLDSAKIFEKYITHFMELSNKGATLCTGRSLRESFEKANPIR